MTASWSRLREWGQRLAGTFRRGRSDADLEAELRVHAEIAAESARRSGTPDDAATRSAVLRHGGVTQAIEAQRDQRGFLWMEDFARDVRYGLRGLIRSRGVSVVVIASLALGIGANAAIFSLINALMLRTLAVRAPEQLVALYTHYPGDPPNAQFGWAHYEQLRDQNHVFSDVIGTSVGRLQVAVAGATPEDVRGEYVVGSYFPALGVHAVVGRLIGDEDDRLGAADANVTVLSWSYWQRHFNLDPEVVGTHLTVNGTTTSVIGVAPRAFTGLVTELQTDVWVPTALSPQRKTGALGVAVIARLKPGVSLAQARADMSVLNQPRVEDIARKSHDPKWRHATMDVEPAAHGISVFRDWVSKPLFVLMAGAGVLLLLACVNIASVLLARGAARRREMAVRVSLGAGRRRLTRLVLTESLLLAAAGSAIGLVLAAFGADALVRVLVSMRGPGPRPDGLQIIVRPDGPVLLFTAGVGLGTALLFSLMPVWQALSCTPASYMREMGGAGEPRSRRLFGKGLVIAQVALSAVLLSTAGLFARYVSDLRTEGLGFNPHAVVVVSLNPRGSHMNAAQLTIHYQALLDRLHAIPGVRSVTLSTTTPVVPGSWLRFGHVQGFEEAPEDKRYLYLNAVAPEYFETLGTPVLSGREFETTDAGRPPLAIINQATARYYFATRSPLGQRMTFDGDPLSYEIVGVVADAKYEDLHQPAPRTVYLDAFQAGHIGSQFSLRTDVAPLSIAQSVRRVAQEVVPRVPVDKVTTLADQLDQSIVLERTIATLSGIFGGLGMLLAAMGLFGLLAFTVARRTSEIGVRMALGATARGITWMVLKSALALVAVGLVLATPAVFWSKRLAASMIENLPTSDSLPIAFAVVVMTVVAIAAAYVPARRAARVRPVEALRHE